MVWPYHFMGKKQNRQMAKAHKMIGHDSLFSFSVYRTAASGN